MGEWQEGRGSGQGDTGFPHHLPGRPELGVWREFLVSVHREDSGFEEICGLNGASQGRDRDVGMGAGGWV